MIDPPEELGTPPLVTVLVPSRSEARFIGECLDSIVENGYPESWMQVLVIDGDSEDGTVEIVKQFEQRHPCMAHICNNKRSAPAALNLGRDAPTGEFIIWMSAHNQY